MRNAVVLLRKPTKICNCQSINIQGTKLLHRFSCDTAFQTIYALNMQHLLNILRKARFNQ